MTMKEKLHNKIQISGLTLRKNGNNKAELVVLLQFAIKYPSYNLKSS